MFEQPTSLQIALPDWLSQYADERERLTDDRQRMAFVIGAARENSRRGTGGPFAAAVFECQSGRLVSLGVNLVTLRGMSVLHAEVVALSLAQQKLGHYDLGADDLPAHELVTSTEPCSMCLGAVPWSGVRRLITGARDADARAIGFDEGAKPPSWEVALRERGIQVTTDVCRREAAEALREYAALGGTIYNAGGDD